MEAIISVVPILFLFWDVFSWAEAPLFFTQAVLWIFLRCYRGGPRAFWLRHFGSRLKASLLFQILVSCRMPPGTVFLDRSRRSCSANSVREAIGSRHISREATGSRSSPQVHREATESRSSPKAAAKTQDRRSKTKKKTKRGPSVCNSAERRGFSKQEWN